MAARNLVVVRAGNQSLHPGWTQDLATRDWDLVVSYFGDDPTLYRSAAERRIDDKGQKLEGLIALFAREPAWREYDYIWLPDDDLATDQAAISELFRTMAHEDLAIAQPSLSWASYFSYGITLHHPSFALRYTDFVEVMAPAFSRAALETCLPTFSENLSGWGLGFVWAYLLANRPRQAAIVDRAQVTHTRPVGGPSYAKLDALGISADEERSRVLTKYGIAKDIMPRALEAVEASGRRLDPAVAADAARLRQLRIRDGFAYRAAQQKRAEGEHPAHLPPTFDS
jgi:hypothetical protein